MSAFRRLALPSAALVALGLLSAVLPGRAQQAPSDRFAFADTTLLRDTLGLSFDRLFELADSLRITPDTLRALSIRYGFVPARLVALADSMRAPVDSVGVILDRERFNPLASRGERVTDFNYSTGYNLQRTRSEWSNTLDTRLVRDAMVFSQRTTIIQRRFETTRATTTQQDRRAENEIGYRLGANTSVGGRAVLTGYNSDDPSSIRKIDDQTSQYQASLRTRSERPGFSTELNAFSGYVDENRSTGTKRGVNGEVNGRLVLERGAWLQNDWSGRATGNFARTTPTVTQLTQNTRDVAQEVRSTLTLWSSSPVSFNADLAYRDSRPQLPDDNGLVVARPSANTDLNSALRIRLDSDRSLNLQGGLSTSKATFGTTSGGTESHGGNFQAEARARVLDASLEARFRLGSTRTETPELDSLGGYGEKGEDRGLEVVLTRQFMKQRLSTSATGRMSLQRSRYYTIGSYASLPVPRDVASQSYRLDTRYSLSREFSTSAGLEVTRQEQVNLTSSSVGSNTLTRTYRATWQWTYRMLQALTITQLNTLLANYSSYPFNAPADRLLLEYANTTTLNAILTPRFSMDLNHIARIQPSGGYTAEQIDGLYYFRPADETRSYSLGVRTTYTPGPVLTLTMEPRYVYSSRDGTIKGVLVPQRSNANLSFSGSALLNYSVGRKGRLSGSITRLYNGDRTVGYKSGIIETVLRSNTDNWNANLQFTWKL